MITLVTKKTEEMHVLVVSVYLKRAMLVHHRVMMCRQIIVVMERFFDGSL